MLPTNRSIRSHISLSPTRPTTPPLFTPPLPLSPSPPSPTPQTPPITPLPSTTYSPTATIYSTTPKVTAPLPSPSTPHHYHRDHQHHRPTTKGACGYINSHIEASIEVLLAKERILKLIQARDDKQIESWSLPELLLQLLNDSRTIDEMLKQRKQTANLAVQQEREEQTAQIFTPNWNFSMISDDEEHSIQYKKYLEKNSNAITTVLPTEETEYSLSMGYKHLSTISETESDEVIKSSVKNHVPIPSEYEVTSDDESECDVPVKDESSPVFTTFSNPIFDCIDDFTSSDDELLSNEDVLMEDFKVYSNSLFDDEEINSNKIDPYYFNAEYDLIESLSNQDTLFHSSPKLDYLEEFSGELIPTSIIDEEIDVFTGMDDLMPPGSENDNYDSEGDIHIFKELHSNDTPPLPKNESSNFDHHNDLSFPRPPPEPPDVEIFFELDSGVLTTNVIIDARAAMEGYTGVHGGFGYVARNEEGRAILDFATAHDLGELKACKDCRVFPREACSSQHSLLALDIPFKRVQRRREGSALPRILWKKLMGDATEEFRYRVAEGVSTRVEALAACDADSMWNILSSIIKDVAKDTPWVAIGKSKTRVAQRESWWLCEEGHEEGVGPNREPHTECYYSRISQAEVRTALQKMGINKAVGPDQIPIAAWKSLGDEGYQASRSYHEALGESDREKVAKRDLASENQLGFMPERSSVEAIRLIKSLMEKYRER
nr:P-loop containing nucleoside triphosphate hydrolases superfamily protein [Tanacetum cinerariifolium]